MFAPQPFFQKRFRNKTFLVRTRLQSIAFLLQNFDFELGFVMFFESITKPQRETQKTPSDGNYLNITGIFRMIFAVPAIFSL